MPDVFQIDLGQSGWRPSGLQALVEELSRALETNVEPREVEFLGFEGSSSVGEVLSSDEAVQGFCGSKGDTISETDTVDTASASPKVIKAELPERIASELRRPRKLALLAGGCQLAKYTGEADGQGIDFSLKVFDCGHFRLKETLAGGSSPSAARGAIFEGRWEKAPKGIRLEMLLRCVEQQSRRRTSDASVTYEAVQPQARQTTLACVGGSEERLQGHLPTLGEEATSLVELHKEADMVAKQSRARQQVEDDDDDDWECRQLLKPQLPKRPPPRPPPRPKPYRDWDDDHWDSDEPTWPMYLGIFLFIVIFCVFAWLWYEERYSPEAKKEFDEL